jgi:glycerol-3-phosphate dehydrogenase
MGLAGHHPSPYAWYWPIFGAEKMVSLKTKVLIIGGGITGAGIARDLTLRGVDCILTERRDINAGASGANHGLLHSGARYVRSDPAAAQECRDESRLLKKLAPQCIENTGGLFVAVEGDDENYVADFPHRCTKHAIPFRELDIHEAREIEPVLSEKLIAAFMVEDASVDPFRLSLENIAQALELGGRLLLRSKVVAFKLRNKRIETTHIVNEKTGEEIVIEADQVINATGAWAAEIAALAGAHIDILYSKGSLLITDKRISYRVLNRLRQASDADILVPGGTVSILGTTSIRLDSVEDIRPTISEIDHLIDMGSAMVPSLETTRYIRAYAGVRPLVGSRSLKNGRALSRGFALLDHTEEGVQNLVSIVGGKLTTYRKMAEKTADLVCRRIAVHTVCQTRTQALPPSEVCQWTFAGFASRLWIQQKSHDDRLLCECEMVPSSAVDSIIDSIRKQKAEADLYAIGRRSRIGKGSCQGAFCGIRVTAYMHDRGELVSDQGLKDLRAFLSSRWRGMRPMLWDTALIQEELQEAVHCGIFGLEL